MKTLEQVREQYKSSCFDGRDLSRLAQFIPQAELEGFGLKLKEGATHEHKELTRDAVLAQLKDDVEFGFQKALNRRGLSSGLMFQVVQMWNWLLDEGLGNWSDDEYAMYGLPLFKATAVKYGWPNPIGDDLGSERKYND